MSVASLFPFVLKLTKSPQYDILLIFKIKDAVAYLSDPDQIPIVADKPICAVASRVQWPEQ